MALGIISAVFVGASGLLQMNQQRRQAAAQASALRRRAQAAALEAQAEARDQGVRYREVRKQHNAAIARQRASWASRGMDLSGTILDIEEESALTMEENLLTLGMQSARARAGALSRARFDTHARQSMLDSRRDVLLSGTVDSLASGFGTFLDTRS